MANAAPVTLHSINLTGLGAHTTYFYRVTSVDAATNSATAPAAPAAPATFTTNFATITDTTTANFGAGSPGTTTYVAATADGEVTLAPAAGSDFNGGSLPAGSASSVLAAGGEVTVSGGSLRVDGAWARTTGTFAPGRTLEFIATFTSTANQSVGLGNTLNESPWAMFSTRAGGALRVSTRSGTTPIELSLGTTYLGAPHTYRIVWTASSVVYSVDGAVVATQNTAIGTSMRGVVRDNTPGGNAVLVNWMRLTPVRPDRDVHLARHRRRVLRPVGQRVVERQRAGGNDGHRPLPHREQHQPQHLVERLRDARELRRADQRPVALHPVPGRHDHRVADPEPELQRHHDAVRRVSERREPGIPASSERGPAARRRSRQEREA